MRFLVYIAFCLVGLPSVQASELGIQSYFSQPKQKDPNQIQTWQLNGSVDFFTTTLEFRSTDSDQKMIASSDVNYGVMVEYDRFVSNDLFLRLSTGFRRLRFYNVEVADGQATALWMKSIALSAIVRPNDNFRVGGELWTRDELWGQIHDSTRAPFLERRNIYQTAIVGQARLWNQPVFELWAHSRWLGLMAMGNAYGYPRAGYGYEVGLRTTWRMDVFFEGSYRGSRYIGDDLQAMREDFVLTLGGSW